MKSQPHEYPQRCRKHANIVIDDGCWCDQTHITVGSAICGDWCPEWEGAHLAWE